MTTINAVLGKFEDQTFDGIERMKVRLQAEYPEELAELPKAEVLKLAISLLNLERLGLQKVRFWMDLVGKILPLLVALLALVPNFIQALK